MTKQFFALHCARYNAENVFEEYVETVEVSPSAGKPRHFFATNAKWGCSKDYPADPRSVALNLAAQNAASVRKVEELPTYEAFETAARAAHERRFAAKGEAYATAEEMTYHREYPLETFEAIEAEVCLELGAKIERYGRVRYMSADDRALFERQVPQVQAVTPAQATAREDGYSDRMAGKPMREGFTLEPHVANAYIAGYVDACHACDDGKGREGWHE